jgi:mannose-6-phosphate isomerase-like protein (cupin superfamily)
MVRQYDGLAPMTYHLAYDARRRARPPGPQAHPRAAHRPRLDQLAAIARALGSTLDQLVEPVGDDDVVIRPERDEERGITTWLLTREPNPTGKSVGKMRITRPAPPPGADVLRVHSGRDWLTVLSGTLVLLLGERRILVQPGEAAEFSTMVPHYFYAHESGPVEIIAILDHEGRRNHLHPHD